MGHQLAQTSLIGLSCTITRRCRLLIITPVIDRTHRTRRIGVPGGSRPVPRLRIERLIGTRTRQPRRRRHLHDPLGGRIIVGRLGRDGHGVGETERIHHRLRRDQVVAGTQHTGGQRGEFLARWRPLHINTGDIIAGSDIDTDAGLTLAQFLITVRVTSQPVDPQPCRASRSELVGALFSNSDLARQACRPAARPRRTRRPVERQRPRNRVVKTGPGIRRRRRTSEPLISPVRHRKPRKRGAIRIAGELLVVARRNDRRSIRIDQPRSDRPPLLDRQTSLVVRGPRHQPVISDERRRRRRRNIPRGRLSGTRRIRGSTHQHGRRIRHDLADEPRRRRDTNLGQRRHTRSLITHRPRRPLRLRRISSNTTSHQRRWRNHRNHPALLVIRDLSQRPLILVTEPVHRTRRHHCCSERVPNTRQTPRSVIREIRHLSSLTSTRKRRHPPQLNVVTNRHITQNRRTAIPSAHPTQQTIRRINKTIPTTNRTIITAIDERHLTTRHLIDKSAQEPIDILKIELSRIRRPHRRRQRDRIGIIGRTKRRNHPIQIGHRPGAIGIANQRRELTRRPRLARTPHRLIGPLGLLLERHRGAHPTTQTHHTTRLHLKTLPTRTSHLQPPRTRQTSSSRTTRPIRHTPTNITRRHPQPRRLPPPHRLTRHRRHHHPTRRQPRLAPLTLRVNIHHKRPSRGPLTTTRRLHRPDIRSTINQRLISHPNPRFRRRRRKHRLHPCQIRHRPHKTGRPNRRISHHQHRHRRRRQPQRPIQLDTLKQRHHRTRPISPRQRRQTLRRPTTTHLNRNTSISRPITLRPITLSSTTRQHRKPNHHSNTTTNQTTHHNNNLTSMPTTGP